MLLYWLAGIGGGVGIGVLIGFFAGAAAQRRLQAHSSITESFREAARHLSDEDRYEDVDVPTTGTGNPMGPPPPTYATAKAGKRERLSDLVKKTMGGLRRAS